MLGNSGKYALVDGLWLHVRPVRTPMQALAAKPAETASIQKAPVNNQPPHMIAADQVPANAKTLEVTNHMIAESYVTKGKPSAIPAASKQGFEFKLLTHPNELYAGESLKAQVLVNGKQVPNLEIDVFKGASSYEPNAKREQPHVKTNAKSEVDIKLDQAGIYLITTVYLEANEDATQKSATENFTYG